MPPMKRTRRLLFGGATGIAALALPPMLIAAIGRLFDDSSASPPPISREVAPAEPSTVPVVSSNNDCGPACLYLICRLAGRPQPLAAIRRKAKTTDAGTLLLHLRNAARDLGFEAEAIQGDFAALASHIAAKETFAILHVRSNHFIVAEGTTEDGAVRMLDPAGGASLVSEEALRNAYRWEGVMLCLTIPAEGGKIP